MILFDQLVDTALKNHRELAPLRMVVEKELLHHDILREMAQLELLSSLTFMGGSCLRDCYGAQRLSEDLDFTGGSNFHRKDLVTMGSSIKKALQIKYDLPITVSEPIQERTPVSTWKIKIETHPKQKNLPAQRINIDICALPSHDRRPMMLRNIYGIDMGTSGLILQAESREEILADKIMALALRLNRIKHRDLWDIAWLKQQGVELPYLLIPKKIHDHRREKPEFINLLKERLAQLSLPTLRHDFLNEMKRFLPTHIISETVEKKEFWDYLCDLVRFEGEQVLKFLKK